MSNEQDNEPFLSRWSRQKQQQARQPGAKPKPSVVASPEEPEPEIDLSKLTKLEDLTAESDITQFLQKGVPDALQKLALRKMWSLDPAIRDFVEVAENQWDFNLPGGIHGLFEEVAEGTDVSVWLAQATPSVFGDDVKKPVPVAGSPDVTAIATEPPGDVENAAMQHADGTVTTDPLIVARAGQPQRSDAPEPVPAQQPVDVTETSSLPMRRRHGGALPA